MDSNDLYTTHSDIKLILDDEDGQIRRAQNKTSSDRVWEYAFPLTCSLELDLQVQTEYQAIDTCDRAFTYLFESNVTRQYSPYKMAVNITPMNSNTRGGAAIGVAAAVKSIQQPVVADCRRIKNVFRVHSPSLDVLVVGFKQLGNINRELLMLRQRPRFSERPLKTCFGYFGLTRSRWLSTD